MRSILVLALLLAVVSDAAAFRLERRAANRGLLPADMKSVMSVKERCVHFSLPTGVPFLSVLADFRGEAKEAVAPRGVGSSCAPAPRELTFEASLGVKLKLLLVSMTAAVEGRVALSSPNAPSFKAMIRGFARSMVQDVFDRRGEDGEWPNMMAHMTKLVAESLKAVDPAAPTWAPATVKKVALAFDAARAAVAADMDAYLKPLADSLFCITGANCVLKEAQTGQALPALPKAGIRAEFAGADVHTAVINLTVNVIKALVAKLGELTLQHMFGATDAQNPAGVHAWDCTKLAPAGAAPKYFHTLTITPAIRARMDPEMAALLGAATTVNVPGQLFCALSESYPFSRFTEDLEMRTLPSGAHVHPPIIPGIDGLEEQCSFDSTVAAGSDKVASLFCLREQLLWDGSKVGTKAPGACKVKMPIAAANLFERTFSSLAAAESAIALKMNMNPPGVRNKVALYALNTLQQTMRESLKPADTSVFGAAQPSVVPFDFTWRATYGAPEPQVVPAVPGGGMGLRRSDNSDLATVGPRADWLQQETAKPTALTACPANYDAVPDPSAPAPPVISVAPGGAVCGWLLGAADLSNIEQAVAKRVSAQVALMDSRAETFDLAYDVSVGVKLRASFFASTGASDFCSADDFAEAQAEARVFWHKDVKVHAGAGTVSSGTFTRRYQLRLLGNPTAGLAKLRLDLQYMSNPSEIVIGVLVPLDGKTFGSGSNDLLTASGISVEAGASTMSTMLPGLAGLAQSGQAANALPAVLAHADVILGDVLSLLTDKLAAWFNAQPDAQAKAQAQAASALKPGARTPAAIPADANFEAEMGASLGALEADGAAKGGAVSSGDAKDKATLAKDASKAPLLGALKKVGKTVAAHVWSMAKDSAFNGAVKALNAALPMTIGLTLNQLGYSLRLQLGLKKGPSGWAFEPSTTLAELVIGQTTQVKVAVETGAGPLEVTYNAFDATSLTLSKLNQVIAAMKQGGGSGLRHN